MLNIYLKENDIQNKKIIDYNDIQFNQDILMFSSDKNLDKLKSIISEIEEGKLLSDKKVETKRGDIINIEDICSGSKTLFNIINHPDEVVDTVECGSNAMEYLFKNIKDGNILISYIPYINNDYKINATVFYKGKSSTFNSSNALLESISSIVDA